MRQMREELLEQFPSWNEDKHDIVKTFYGDEPLIIYNENEYQKYQTLTGTMANIMCSYAYVYSQNGEYNIYRTLIGEIFIKPDGVVLGGTISVKYRGKYHSIHLNMMYGWKTLDILKIGENVVGFSNKDGTGSPSINTKEMDKETIKKILNMPLDDYGVSIQKFMKTARQVYDMDGTNYIMEKRFGARK